jgi:hypothetical protein
LSATQISDVSAASLVKVDSLRALNLSYLNVTTKGLGDALSNSLPLLEELEV